MQETMRSVKLTIDRMLKSFASWVKKKDAVVRTGPENPEVVRRVLSICP